MTKSRFKILQVIPKIPYGLSNGGDIGIFNLTKSMKRVSSYIDWIGFAHETIEDENLDQIKKP